jgi:SAM-dependent methyltransferase
MNTRHLDLGCGKIPRNPYHCDELWGIDLSVEAVGIFPFIKHANLSVEPIPFEDDFFHSVSAYDFLEHVPRVLSSIDNSATRFPFVELMNEIWRVLKNHGSFYAVTPGFPRHVAFVDPTHVNPISAKTHCYFTLPHCGACIYGFHGCFRVRRVKWIRPKYEYEPFRLTLRQYLRKIEDFIQQRNSHLLWELEAVKPNPLQSELK